MSAVFNKWTAALRLIAEWKPPYVQTADGMIPMGIARGSNGEREYFRDIARAALVDDAEIAADRTARFTPGPWSPYEGDPVIIIDRNGASVGEMSSGSPRTPLETQIANARLAACAPELYEALQSLVTRFNPDEQASYVFARTEIKAARAVLAKAVSA